MKTPIERLPHVAVLFARSDSVYKLISGTDVWDEERDARLWPGGLPVIAHPPCRAWGRLRHFAKPQPHEKDLAIYAVDMVRKYGGVLEHPEASLLWKEADLPPPGAPPDSYGGWTLAIRQCDWGHPTEKKTWLYIVGMRPDDLPRMPAHRDPVGVIKPCRTSPRRLKIVTKAEREKTPPHFAVWLVELVMQITVPHA